MGANSRWALIRGWALVKFSPFSASVDLTKQVSVKYSENKTPSSGQYLIISDWSLSGRGCGWVGWALIKFRMDTYSRWALIRGCALIRINTVIKI